MADAADQETAPLLDNPQSGSSPWEQIQTRLAPLTAYVASLAHEPLTELSKALIVVVLALFLLTSTFVGLFAGAQHNLNKRIEDGDPVTVTKTLEVTVTQFATSTCVFPTTTVLTSTTTSLSTTVTTTTSYSTTTTYSTTTSVSTTTAVPIPVPPPPPEEKPCLTPQCVVLSASILSSLDTTHDPCENFYMFASGGWLKSHPLPADKGSYGTFAALQKQNHEIIQKILEPDANSPHSLEFSYDDQIVRKLRGLYHSCLDEKTLDSIGMEPLVQFVRTLRKLYRGESTDIDFFWDDDAEKNPYGLTAALSFLHSQGINAFFDFGIDGDVGVDPNQMVLWFSQADFGLPSKEYYGEASIRELYQNVTARLLLTLDDTSKQTVDLVTNEPDTDWPPWWPPWGPGKDKKKDRRTPAEKAHDLAKEVIEFESRVANASLDPGVLLGDPIATYNPVDVSLLSDALPEIHFPEYFASFTPRSYPEVVVVTYPAYPTALSTILRNTSSEVIEAYLVVRAALRIAPLLGLQTEAWKAVRTLDETLKGIKKGAVGDRAAFCVGQVEHALGFAAGRYFVNATFGGASRMKATKVIDDIIDAFEASVPHIDWMDKASAIAAAQKADAIRVKVGFPTSPNTTDARSVASYYSLVESDEKHFVKNMLGAAASEEFKKWSKLGKRRDVNEWKMFPSTVNAYFDPPANEIVFPAGILQPPFFSQDWPAYIAYGAFGQIAAHELTHAFDSAGRLYNQQGKLEQWWTNTTSEGFEKRTACIVNQFSAYKVSDGKGGEIHVNGNLTSGENIGDSGFILAYRAWKTQYQASFLAGNEYLLPGLNYTREQLFFISFGRMWAQNIKPASLVAQLRTDPHSPTNFRVDGTLSNIPEFAKAFNCPKDARLNPPPEKQCIFW